MPILLPNNTSARSVPVTLYLQLLFGGLFNQFGWLFFGFTMIFVWVFVIHCDVLSFWEFSGPLQTVNGIVVRCVDTGAAEGGDEDSPGTPIYKIDYMFTPPGIGVRCQGTSYTTGVQMDIGKAVTVEYNAKHTAYSRIRGMRSAEYGAAVCLIIILPVIGLFLVKWGMRSGLRTIALLRSGILATGTLINMTTVDNDASAGSTVYRMIFQFPLQTGGMGNAQLETSEVKPAWKHYYTAGQQAYAPGTDESIATQPAQTLPNKVQEMVLYDAADPTFNLLPTIEFGNRFHFNNDGDVVDPNPIIGPFVAILPALVVIGHGWYALSLFFH